VSGDHGPGRTAEVQPIDTQHEAQETVVDALVWGKEVEGRDLQPGVDRDEPDEIGCLLAQCGHGSTIAPVREATAARSSPMEANRWRPRGRPFRS
jgi:hypothetical protein